MSAPVTRRDPIAWTARYRDAARSALQDSIVPFWQRTIDAERGGVFNCWNNAGTHLASRDKFTWSQGRFLWLWSRLGEMAARGALNAAGRAFLPHAEKTAQFLEAHAFLDDGRCAFLLSEEGGVKEAIPGLGPAPSIYADCFVVMGFAEFARVSGDRARLDAAWRLFEHIERRIAAGGYPLHPTPIPAGYDVYAVAMIMLNLTLVLHDACEALGDARFPEARERRRAAAARIFDRFMLPDGTVLELRTSDDRPEDTVMARHINPGHTLEGLWMLLTVAVRELNPAWLARAHQAVRRALEHGWDEEHGGILYYVDRAGGALTGAAGTSEYEARVRASSDTKLWWVHSEAIYATALSYRLSGDEKMREWFERVWDYSFRIFPHPDPAIGEWIQIRDRRGTPLERVVALPVKDPYHVARNLIQVIALFDATRPVVP